MSETKIFSTHLSPILPIAIILPVFNTSPYLKQCLESILNQTYSNFHIYAIDDGSSDSSLDILLQYQQQDSRIKVSHQQNSGLGSARNKALSLINFKQYSFISFIDSDDIIHPKFLEKLLLTALKTNSDISICSINSLVDNNLSEPPFQHYTRAHELNQKEYIELTFSTMRWRNVNGSGGMVWKALYKSSLLVNERFTNLSIVEDEAFCVQIARNVKRAFYIPVPLYYYRARAGQLIRESKFYEKFLYGRILCSSISSRYPKDLNYLVNAALAKSVIIYYNKTKQFPNIKDILLFYPTIKLSYENGFLSSQDWTFFLKIYKKSPRLILKSIKHYIRKQFN